MLFDERDTNAVVGGRRLQLAVEADAETLAQRQAPGAIDSPAPRRMENQLHAAGLVEKTFGDDLILRWHSAEDGDGIGDVVDDLLGRGLRHRYFVLKPARRRDAIADPLRPPRCANRRPPEITPACAPAPRPSRMEYLAATPGRRQPILCRNRRGECARSGCLKEKYPRPNSRWRNLRAPCRRRSRWRIRPHCNPRYRESLRRW